MDVVLGVAVTGRVARLAMVGSPASGGEVFDQYALDLPDDATDRSCRHHRRHLPRGGRLGQPGGRDAALPARRVAGGDAAPAVSSAGVQNVEVVAEAEAATALARSVGADAALLLADDDTVSLAVVGEDEESTSVLASLPIGVGRCGRRVCGGVGSRCPPARRTGSCWSGSGLDLDSIAAELSSSAPVEVPPDAGFAIARGAAQTAEPSGFPAGAATMMAPAAAEATMMAPAAGDATQMAPAAGDATQMAPAAAMRRRWRWPAATTPQITGRAVGPLLAYSQEEPGDYEMSLDSIEEFIPEQDDEPMYTAVIAPPPPGQC